MNEMTDTLQERLLAYAANIYNEGWHDTAAAIKEAAAALSAKDAEIEKLTRARDQYCEMWESNAMSTARAICKSLDLDEQLGAAESRLAALESGQREGVIAEVRAAAKDIIDGLKRERERSFSGYAFGAVEAVELLRDAAICSLTAKEKQENDNAS